MLVGQAKKDYEKWLCNNNTPFWRVFNEEWITPSMQYGVIIDWFDSVGIVIEIDFIFHLKHWCSSTIELDGRYEIYDTLKTRHQARQKAIDKAVEIYNKRYEDRKI